LRPWIAKRASFPISFLLRHSGPRGRPSWNARRHAPPVDGVGHREGKRPWAEEEEEGEKGCGRNLGPRLRKWRSRRVRRARGVAMAAAKTLVVLSVGFVG